MSSRSRPAWSRFVVLVLILGSYIFAEFSLPGGLVRRLWGKGSDDPGVQVVAEPRGHGYRLLLTTRNCLDLTVTVEVPSENTLPSRPVPFTVGLRGQQQVELASFEARNAAEKWNFSYRYHWLYGCQGGIPDGTVYALPFAPTNHYKLLQGPLGTFSHQAGSGDDYAYDWAMPEGSVVLAARDGVVIGLRSDSTAHGVGDRFKNSANYIILRHADGTYGEYLHLQPNAALVKLGESVRAGQPIGRSGNTGYTSRPHLHFGVFRIRDDQTRESLAVKVRTGSGVQNTLEEGRVY